MPANSDLPIPPETCLPTEPDLATDVTGRDDSTLLDLSSSSRLPGTGASRVRQTNLTFGMAFIRASISSLFFRSVWQYICQPKTWLGSASATICSGAIEALLDMIWRAVKREQARAMPASPAGLER